MHEKPVRTALLPNTCVADRCFYALAVFRFFRKMHRDGSPSQRAAPHNLQIFVRGQAPADHVREKFLLHSVVIFLPAMIGERSQIVEYESIVLGIELGGSFCIPRTPRGA